MYDHHEFCFTLEIKVEYCCGGLRSTHCQLQPQFSVAFTNARLVGAQHGITERMNLQRMPSAPKWQRFNRVTLLCPVLWLNRARPGRRGVLGGWRGAKLSTPATALVLLEAGRGSILWQASVRRREEPSFVIQNHYIKYYLLLF